VSQSQGLPRGTKPEYWEQAVNTLEKRQAEAKALGHPFLMEHFEIELSGALSHARVMYNAALEPEAE
jgi:hypothetical protein